MTASESCSGQAKPLDAGMFQPEISSFCLHLAAEGKAVKTVRTYTEAVQWFAAAHLRREANRNRWEEVRKQDVQEWVAWLLGRYSAAYASNQYRALQQFFKWLVGEEEIPDPMGGLKPPRVPEKPVPVFTGEELPQLRRTCAGRGFQERRDAAMIALLEATGIRLSELAQIRYDPGDPRRSDVDLQLREITVHGKGRKSAATTATGKPRKSPPWADTMPRLARDMVTNPGPLEARQGRSTLSAADLRQMAVSEFTAWLRGQTNKQDRPFQEHTIRNYADAARTLDKWMTAAASIDEDFTACDTALLNRFFAEYLRAHTQPQPMWQPLRPVRLSAAG